MKKLLKEETQKIKLEIKNRYLAGESVLSIAKSFGICTRTIYYHLGKLTPKEKGLHAQNYHLRKLSKKGKTKGVKDVNQKASKPAKKREGKKTFVQRQEKTSLAGFIQG